jgi:8-oxo-dGTP pyrophosphatase MutT (NUDIX family)
METERCAGGIVLGDSGTIALVWSTNSQSWLFPKGRIEEGEDDETAARREVAEETGLAHLEFIGDLGTFVRSGRNGRADKSIRMFLFAAAQGASLAPTLEIEKAEWISFSRVSEVLGRGANEIWFSADRAWFASVFERVRQALQRD